MQFNTQSSSKPRLKNDTLGNDTLRILYEQYNTLNDTQFLDVCVDTIQRGGGNQARKDEIVRAIRQSNRKEVVLKKTQDFILAGMGLGV